MYKLISRFYFILRISCYKVKLATVVEVDQKALFCRNFGKELVILFHRTAAAPWGHVASIIKRSSTGVSLSFGSTPTTVSNRSFSLQPLTACVFGAFHHSQDPRATNARAEFKGTGHTQLSSSKHFICKPSNTFTKPLPYQTYFSFSLTTKPYQTYSPYHHSPNLHQTLQNLTTFNKSNHTLS